MRYVLISALIFLAAGCGQKSSEPATVPPATKSGEPATAAPATKSGEPATAAPATEKPAPTPPAKSDTATPPAAKMGPAGPPKEAALGEPAPDFELTDTDGKSWKLSDHRGKVVVLEWFNPGCPFVKYAHGKGPLADLAKRSVSDDVLWVAVNSGASGKQGHGLEANRAAKTEWGIEHPILLDAAGAVGRLYDAKTTPELYVVDKDGELVYRGALDNAPLGRVDGGETLVNYVTAALADLAAGRPVATPETTSYGCSVKY